MTTPLCFRALALACVASASLLAPTASAPPSASARARPARVVCPARAYAQGGSAETRTITFTVTDEKGNFLKGLRRERFNVFDGKSRREIVSFGDADAPATVGILLDTSGSLFARDITRPDRATRLRLLRDALALFLDRGNPSNEYFLIAFNQGPQLFVEPTKDRAAVLSAFDRIAAANLKGQTALYDALYLALEKASRGSHRRRAVVAVTDGLDNVSRYSLPEVKRALAEGDVTLYALAVFDEDSPLAKIGYDILYDLTKFSGGSVLHPHEWAGLGDAAAYLAQEMREGYEVGFVPAPPGKDGWHDVKIKMGEVRDGRGKKIKTVLRARDGFYDAGAARR